MPECHQLQCDSLGQGTDDLEKLVLVLVLYQQ